MSGPRIAQAHLASVDWALLPDGTAAALWQLVVLCCRAERGMCWCGCHATVINDGPAVNCACARLGVPEGKRCGQCGRKGAEALSGPVESNNGKDNAPPGPTNSKTAKLRKTRETKP